MSDLDKNDIKYMRMALKLAEKGAGNTSPNPMVGAVIVKDDKVIGKGYHEKCGEGHAEVNAFKNAKDDTEGATIYVTLEPCSHYGRTPPCADLIVSKKIKRAVIAMTDPNPLVAGRGIKKMRDAGIDVTVGVLEEESKQLNEVFIKYITTKIPFVLYKSAMTLDGKIASYTGKSQWISCEESRAECQQLRHQLSAIMVGINTVLADNPMLTCRMDGGKNPIRIILDSKMRIPTDCNIVKTAKKVPTILAVCEENEKSELLKNSGIEILNVPEFNGGIDMQKLMALLGEKGIDSILLEGGGTVAFSAFSAGVVDKVRMYIAPKILGGTAAKTPVEGIGFDCPDCASLLEKITQRMSGEDIVIEGYVRR